jgi:hypothetical protein
VLLTVLMWSSVLPPATSPLVDDQIIEALPPRADR